MLFVLCLKIGILKVCSYFLAAFLGGGGNIEVLHNEFLMDNLSLFALGAPPATLIDNIMARTISTRRLKMTLGMKMTWRNLSMKC